MNPIKPGHFIMALSLSAAAVITAAAILASIR